MTKWTLTALLVALPWSAHAKVYDVSGDLNIGIQEDYMQGTLCQDPMVIFKLYETLAEYGDDIKEPHIQAYIAKIDRLVKNGECTEVPPSSAFITAIRTAKISGKKRPESMYGLAKVRVGGHWGYTMPNYVGSVGQMIIQQGRQHNQKTGRPSYQ